MNDQSFERVLVQDQLDAFAYRASVELDQWRDLSHVLRQRGVQAAIEYLNAHKPGNWKNYPEEK